MTPVYFPYTYIPDTIRTAILSLFDRIIVYRPTSAAAPDIKKKDRETGTSEQELIEERLPLIKYNGMIEKAFKDHLNWAEYHKKDQIRNLKSYMDTIPFFTDSSSFKIKSEIRNHPGKKQDQELDLEFKAGLFLMYAEYLDIRHTEINKGLQSVQNKTDEMLRQLKGEDSLLNGRDMDIATDGANDPLGYMIKERIDAWASLMVRDIPDSGLFLTANQDAADTLLNDMPGAEKILDYPEITCHGGQDNTPGNWKKEFGEYIRSLAAQTDPQPRPESPLSPISGKGKDRFSFTLYSVNGITPVDFFSRFSHQPPCDSEKKEKSSYHMNTLIGVIQLQAC